MTDYHAKQFDGGPTTCDGRNCAAASCAMAIAAATGYRVRLTSDIVRTQSGVSCVPGVHSPSGGLYITDVERVCTANGVAIDYGRSASTGPRRWPSTELEARLQRGEGAVLLGDYDALARALRASSTFLGDHSVWVHDYRVVSGQKQIHWHDPLRADGMWIALSAALSYWQKPGGAVSGFAGFVKVEQEADDLPIIYATPGRNRVQVRAGTAYYRSPTDATPSGTISSSTAWFDEIAYPEIGGKADTSWVALDGISATTSTAVLRCGWIRVGDVTRREAIGVSSAELDKLKADLATANAKISAARTALS